MNDQQNRTEPLLATKLYIPPVRPNLVSRPQLLDRLSAAIEAGCKLILVSAPAGFGKTTLLSQWIHADGTSSSIPAGWLSLDASDSDLSRFLTYLILALQAVDPAIGQGLPSALQGPQPPPVESLLTILINDLSALPDTPSLLILDDYHTIKASSVHQALGFLLEHLPPQVHLVVASRSDPPLPLARLRGRGQLFELRIEDLRFDTAQATILLDQASTGPLSLEQAAQLAARTEGWITGLQLAALSLQGRDAEYRSRFVKDFTGSNRFILDYLMEEVLNRESEPIQSFLFQTSILDRMNGDLCDSVLERQQSQAVLEKLERENLFIVPLDAQRRWYRYHRLFADLLRSKLGCEPAVPLHRRASLWYEQHGLFTEAVQHAVTSGDFERAADLVQARAMPMLMQGQLPTLLGWFEQLPDKIIHSRPWLSMYRAWALLLTGQIDSIEPDLQCALQPPTSTDLRGHATSIRAYAAAILGNAARAKELARQALGLLSADELTVRSVVTFVLAGIYVLDQDVVRASRYFAEASQLGLQAGNLHLAVSAAGRVAAMQVLQGELPAAADSYRHTLQMAAEHSGQRSPTAGQAHSGLGSILFEWNDLEGAERHLQQAVEQNKLWGNVESLANSLVNFARLRQVQGDWVGSRELLQQAERAIEQHTVIPLTTSTIAAAWPHLWLAQGDLSAATQWVVDRQLSPDDHFDFVREAEYRTLARVLLAQKRTADAIGLLNRMRAVADHTGRTGTATEILSLLSVAYWAHGDTPTAITTLREALVHAAPGGYVRTFVDQGPPMKHLLGRIGDQHPKVNRQYVQELLSALEAETNGDAVSVGPMAPLSDKATPSLRPTAQPLLEPLSQRELEVLRLVAAGLTNREIAERLFIAVSTVKSHTNHIYGKLAVKNRTQAIAKAQALDLL